MGDSREPRKREGAWARSGGQPPFSARCESGAAAPEGGSIMTILGKILAVVNLVLSLGVGAFIIMTYVARTNWHAAYENVQKQQQVSQADATAFKKEAEEARGQRADLEKQLAEQKQTTAKEQFAL